MIRLRIVLIVDRLLDPKYRSPTICVFTLPYTNSHPATKQRGNALIIIQVLLILHVIKLLKINKSTKKDTE